MDVFLGNILGMLPVLGIHAFERAAELNAWADGERGTLLICKGRSAIAYGRETAQGFVVQSGSLASSAEVDSFQKHFPTISQLRADLLKNGVLVADATGLKFTQDYTFSSPSTASSFVLGSSSNGRTNWKNSKGRTLKEIQEAETQQAGALDS